MGVVPFPGDSLPVNCAYSTELTWWAHSFLGGRTGPAGQQRSRLLARSSPVGGTPLTEPACRSLSPPGPRCSRRSWHFRMSRGTVPTHHRSQAWSPPHPVHVCRQGFTVSIWKPKGVGASCGDSASLSPRPPGTVSSQLLGFISNWHVLFLRWRANAVCAKGPIHTAATETQIIGSVTFLIKRTC